MRKLIYLSLFSCQRYVCDLIQTGICSTSVVLTLQEICSNKIILKNFFSTIVFEQNVYLVKSRATKRTIFESFGSKDRTETRRANFVAQFSPIINRLTMLSRCREYYRNPVIRNEVHVARSARVKLVYTRDVNPWYGESTHRSTNRKIVLARELG